MDFSSHQLESMNQSLIHKSKYFQIDYETELNEEQQRSYLLMKVLCWLLPVQEAEKPAP